MFSFKRKEKTLEKVTEVFQELKSVQFDIKQIDAFAQAVVKGEIKTVINLKGEKLVKDYNPNEGYEEDAPRAIFKTFFTGIVERAREESEFHITENLDEKLLLEVLAVLLRAKEEYRDFLVKQLEKHGLKL